MKKIILTGGGTAGHVTPNIALVPALRELGYDILYVGTYQGIEKELIEKEGIPYQGISSGKLRRYFSLKNFTDPFRVLKGFSEAKKIIKDYKPDVVFSKGGFVTVPVVFAADQLGVPVIIHESDMTPGLANRLSIPHAKKVCHNFPETAEHLPEGKGVLTGSPIRKELFTGNPKAGLKLAGFHSNLPVLLVVGGSLGAKAINEAVRASLDTLTKSFQIIHLTGKGKKDPSYDSYPGYVQFEYISEEMKDLFAAADIILSRAGANAIFEILALHKPNILIPLPASQSRGDQLLNAESFRKQGFSYVLQEEMIRPNVLCQAIWEVYQKRQDYISAMEQATNRDAILTITNLIQQEAK